MGEKNSPAQTQVCSRWNSISLLCSKEISMACYILANTFSPWSVFPGKRKACSVEGKKGFTITKTWKHLLFRNKASTSTFKLWGSLSRYMQLTEQKKQNIKTRTGLLRDVVLEMHSRIRIHRHWNMEALTFLSSRYLHVKAKGVPLKFKSGGE